MSLIKREFAHLPIILAFLASTSYFCFQHSTGISWDFAVYVLNSRYLFQDGFFFEWLRPPLAPALLYVLSGLGSIAEYAYVVIVSLVFAFACVKFGERMRLDRDVFYCLMLSPYVLNWAFFAGTEALSISLLMLSMAYIDGKGCGAFFGLAVLARYTNVTYGIILAYGKKPRDLALLFVTAFLLVLPWMAYNMAEKGHPLYSMADSYFFNIVYRENFKTPFDFSHVFEVLTYYVPFVFYGVFLSLRKRSRADAIMLGFAILSLYSYSSIPVKEVRHLFSLCLPAAYYTARAVETLSTRISPKKTAVLFLVANLAWGLSVFRPLDVFPGLFEGFENLDENCMAESNAWPYINYLGVRAGTFPTQYELGDSIRGGNRILLVRYGTSTEPEYALNRSFTNAFPRIAEADSYVVLGNESVCAPPVNVDESMIELFRRRGYNITIHPLLPLAWADHYG